MVGSSPCQENDPADVHTGAHKSVLESRNPPFPAGMSSGERPIGAAKGKQSDTEAVCQTPPPLYRATDTHEANSVESTHLCSPAFPRASTCACPCVSPCVVQSSKLRVPCVFLDDKVRISCVFLDDKVRIL